MAKNGKTVSDPEFARFLKNAGLSIRGVREKKQLTLEETEAAGYPSWRHLQKVESGQPFTMATLFRIAKALGVKPWELLK